MDGDQDNTTGKPQDNAHASVLDSIYPLAFFGQDGVNTYMQDPAIRTLVEFFRSKGLTTLKEEDRLEQWYEDWLAYQREHGLYAAMLSPEQYSSRGNDFDLLRYSRFLEVFAYCSPAHAYSLHVTFLGLFSILMGSNKELKQEAVATMEAGKLLAFGVSEKDHGSDLLANEFIVANTETEDLVASGAKYYIGNSDVASVISVLGRKANIGRADGRASRAPFTFIALRPKQSAGFRSLGKIRTLGVRAANVGSFEVRSHLLSRNDVIAEGRNAWDAVFGTVTLGKFFLGFGSIGICEHAFEEAAVHLQKRMLYGNAVIDMPHIRSNMAEAYARLTTMKLFAYRPLMALPHVASFAHQVKAFQEFMRRDKADNVPQDTQITMALGQCFTSIAYGQLVAENSTRLKVPEELTSVIFSVLVGDLSTLALQLASIPGIDGPKRECILRMVEFPKTSAADWNFVAQRCAKA